MSLTPADFQARAERKLEQLKRQRLDPRYQTVMGRFVAAGLLTSTEHFVPHRDPITVADALWAGELEPRILELLPALLVKRPALFRDSAKLPDDLQATVQALNKNQTPADFRGIDGAALKRWVPLLGKRQKLPSQLKSFRMTATDVQLISRLSEMLGLNNTEVIRHALRALAARELARQ